MRRPLSLLHLSGSDDLPARTLVRRLLALLFLAGCGGGIDATPPPEPTPEASDRDPDGRPDADAQRSDLGPEAQARRLLALAVARHDMEDWTAADAALTELAATRPNDAVVTHARAVVAFKRGDPEAAAALVESLPDDALGGRVAFLRSRVAYERGDLPDQLTALIAASAADPSRVGWALDVARLGPDAGADDATVQQHFERAQAAVPGNVRVSAERARWALSSSDPDRKEDGVRRARALSRWVEGEAPENPRAILGALRGSRAYRQDAALTEASSAVEPVRAFPLTSAPPTPSAPVGVDVPWPVAIPGDGPVLAAAVLDAMPGEVLTERPRPRLAVLRGDRVSVAETPDGIPAPVGTWAGATDLVALDADADPEPELLVVHAGGLTLLDPKDGAWVRTDTLSLPAAPAHVLVVDIESDHDHDLLVTTADGAVLQTLGVGGFGPLEPTTLPLPRGARPTARDLDGDHDAELFGPSDEGPFVLRNVRQGDYVRDPHATTTTTEATHDLNLDGTLDPLPRPGLPVDVDGDGDLDLLAFGVDPTLWRNELPASPRLSVSLRQPQAKGPSDMRGVVVEVVHGTQTTVLHPERPNLVIGFTDRPAVLRATWPNGVSQFLFDPEPGRHYDMLLPTKLEGSCPFLYAWDGDQHRFVTDLLGLAPVGLALAPGVYAPADPDEYLRLPDWMQLRDGHVDLRFTEELREVTYLDLFEVLAVRHDRRLRAHSFEKWTRPAVDGFDLRFTDAPRPAAVTGPDGADASDIVATSDHRYLGGPEGRPRLQGVLEPWSFIVTLPADVAASDTPVLLLEGWLQWGNTSTNIARAQLGERPMFPVLEVPDGDGWRRAQVDVGLPAGKTKPVYVPLAGAVNPDDPRVRISTDFAVFWDRIAVAIEEDADAEIVRVPATEAFLQPGGFSAMYRPSANGPHLFDYTRRTPWPTRPGPDGEERPLAWTPLTGLRTAFGPVQGLLAAVDDRSVVFGDGEEIALRFAAPPDQDDGRATTWFIRSHGWEKDGDPNVAYSQTTEPIAWSGMGSDPYANVPPETLIEELKATSLTRFVGPDQLVRRLR